MFADMGGSLWMIRGWAAVFLVMGVVAACEVCRRWCGHWVWGVCGAVLYFGAVGHLGRAIMFRPDNVLSALSLVITFLVIEAYRRRAVQLLLAATAVLGLAVTVKVHAVGLVPVVGIGYLLLRREDWPGGVSGAVRSVSRRSGLGLGSAVLLFAVLVVWANGFRPAAEIDVRLCLVIGLLAAYLVATWVLWRRRSASLVRRTVLNPMWPMGAMALVVGLVLPNAFFLDQLVMLLRFVSYAVTGRGINAGFEASEMVSAVVRQWHQPELILQWPLMLLGLLGVWRRLRSGDRTCLLWLVAAGSMWGLAAMRAAVHPSAHHYGPAMALMVPLAAGALSIRVGVGVGGRLVVSRCVVGAVLLVAVVLGPAVMSWRASWWNYDRCAALAALTERLEPELGDDEFIMTDYWAQNADAGFFMLVRDFCVYTPARSYRSLPDTPTALKFAEEARLSPAFYLTSGERRTRVRALADGRWVARSVWGGEWYVRPMGVRRLANIEIGVYRVEGRVAERGKTVVAAVDGGG